MWTDSYYAEMLLASAFFWSDYFVGYYSSANRYHAYADARRYYLQQNKNHKPSVKPRAFKIRFAGRKSNNDIYVVSDRP